MEDEYFHPKSLKIGYPKTLSSVFFCISVLFCIVLHRFALFCIVLSDFFSPLRQTLKTSVINIPAKFLVFPAYPDKVRTNPVKGRQGFKNIQHNRRRARYKMAGQSKIKALGLAPKIEALIASGITTQAEISEALKKEGHKISQSTVSRYLKEERDTRREETRDIVQDHVRNAVPTDLKALEEMELQCLTWAEEDVNAFAHRLAGQHISENIDAWASKIREVSAANPKDKEEIIRDIIRQCLAWVSDDKSLQKARIFAMRMATNIIDLKLRYSGIIEGSQEGGIYFVNPAQGDKLTQDEKTGRFMVIRGGGD